MRAQDLCAARSHVRHRAGRVRRQARLRGLSIGADVRRRRTEPVRDERMHAQELRAAGGVVRMGVRRLLAGDQLRRVSASTELWWGWAGEHVRMHAEDLPAAWSLVRHPAGWVHRVRELRHVRVGADLRRWRPQRVRDLGVLPQVVRTARGLVRNRLGWVQRYRALRRLHRAVSVRRGGGREPVRVYPEDLRTARGIMRRRGQRLRRHHLWHLRRSGHLRWGGSPEPVRMLLRSAQRHDHLPRGRMQDREVR